MEIAVIGDEEFLLGFRLAGIRKVVPVCEKDLEPKLQELLGDRTIGILVMHNEDMDRLPAHVRRSLVESIEPVVISIGRVEEVDLRERIKQAVGVDLWK
jgi:V/A-type H+/Na+-transporting ATPase subunit F